MGGPGSGRKKGSKNKSKIRKLGNPLGVNPKTGKPGIKKPKYVESSNNKIPGAIKTMYNKRNYHSVNAMSTWAEKYGGKKFSEIGSVYRGR
jgi:hypothetical protein